MNPLIAKLLPYLGWPIAALLFTFWLGLKEDLAQQVELCNQDKLQTIAVAERQAREALQGSYERRLTELEGIAMRESEARRSAEIAAEQASVGAAEAQATIRRLMRETGNESSLEEACLVVDVPALALDGLRSQ